MKTLINFVVVSILFAFSSCKDERALNEQGMPDKIIIGVTSGLDPTLRKKALLPIQDYLSKKLSIPVEYVISTDYSTVIEALKSKKIHMAEIAPYAYVIAKKNVDITPIVLLGSEGKPSNYKSIIITNNDKIRSIEDVKANAKNITLGFAEPASASGHLIPKGYLTTIGLDPKTSFKETMFTGGHLGCVMATKSHKIDIGCTTEIIINMMLKSGTIKESDFRVLWTSDPIVANPIVVRNDLNKDLIEKIQRAYLDMSKDAPETLENYLKVYLRDGEHRSYMVSNDSLYDGIRKIASGITELN